MKKFSLIVEKKKQELAESNLVNERNLYLDFAKKYHKEHGVSGPFDKKFKGDKKAQSEYMEALSMAWDENKKKKGIKTKGKKDFDFKKKMNESKAFDMASQMVGDGGDPNYHFVIMCDDYYFEKNGEMIKYSKDIESAPLTIKTTPNMGSYTFGPFMNLEESKMFAESIELDEINGPRMVSIQDRMEGEVFARYLSCKLQPVWDENIMSNSPDGMGSEDDEEYEDPNSEYTYGEETEEGDEE
jgi:hypothetical protein